MRVRSQSSSTIWFTNRFVYVKERSQIWSKNHLHINCLQLLVVIVAVKIWGKKLKGKKLFIFCNNEDSVTVVNSHQSMRRMTKFHQMQTSFQET
jgi:hypothetical protein